MKEKKKKAARVKNKPSRTLANPRKGVELASITDPEGRWRVVERRVDALSLMYAARSITKRQLAAGEAYRDAYAACAGRIPCPLDVTRVRGSGIASPTEAQIRAAQMLGRVRGVLGQMDARILRRVCVEGDSIRDVARGYFGLGASVRDDRYIGRRLRSALDLAAEVLFPGRAGGSVGGVRYAETDARSSHDGGFERGRVAHATLWQIYGFDD